MHLDGQSRCFYTQWTVNNKTKPNEIHVKYAKSRAEGVLHQHTKE